ncbi:hypothetical protein BC835DRAFT_1412055 [Cytidiella melzeri]|nr:hypothetical protein BC835DRAFT_1412055 [Cytidiella melzeri]
MDRRMIGMLLPLVEHVVEVPSDDLLRPFKSLAKPKDMDDADYAQCTAAFKKVAAVSDITAMASAMERALRANRICSRLKVAAKKDYHPTLKIDNDNNEAEGTVVCRPALACYSKHARLRSLADDWAAIEMFISISPTDPFFNYNKISRRPVATSDALYTVIDCVNALLSRQHRECIYSVCLFDSHARIARWDHAGVLITTPFDYVKEPQPFVEFLSLFDELFDQAISGRDRTATLATHSESLDLTNAFKDYFRKVQAEELPLIPDAHSTLDAEYPVYKLRIVSEIPNGTFMDILVRRPIYETTPLSRFCTRGYIGYHVQGKNLVFVKDVWPVMEDDNNEVKAYARLTEFGVPHIPLTHFAGVVKNENGLKQSTQTQNHEKFTRGGQRRILEQTHVRIVQELLFPLERAKNTKTVVTAVRDALVALNAAFTTAKLIHGDISLNNIMVTAEGRGVLGDWDRAFRVSADHQQRGGTWLFQSVYSSTNPPPGKYSLRDDVESMLWVLVYIVVGYCEIEIGDAEHFRSRGDLDSLFSDENSLRLKRFFIQESALIRRRGDNSRFVISAAASPITELLMEFANAMEKYRYQIQPVLVVVKGKKKLPPTRKVLATAQPIVKLFDSVLSLEGWPEADMHIKRSTRVVEGLRQITGSIGETYGVTFQNVLDAINSDAAVAAVEPLRARTPRAPAQKMVRWKGRAGKEPKKTGGAPTAGVDTLIGGDTIHEASREGLQEGAANVQLSAQGGLAAEAAVDPNAKDGDGTIAEEPKNEKPVSKKEVVEEKENVAETRRITRNVVKQSEV